MDRIQLDYTFILADSIGAAHGLDEERFMALGARSMEALAAVQARRSTDLRWLDLPDRKPGLEGKGVELGGCRCLKKKRNRQRS